MKSYWLAKDDPGKRDWVNHFAPTLLQQASTVGVSTAEVTSVTADAAWFDYIVRAQDAAASYAQQWTAYRNLARNGTATAMGPKPVFPDLGTAPDPVAPNIFGRITLLVGRIKKHPGYNPAIGQSLDIIGTEQTVDTTTAQPTLKLELQAGQPNVKWKKGSFDGVEIWVDRGTGTGFVFLAIDTVPDYLDTHALPAPGATALWKYKAIYRLADEPVGLWSNEVSIAVRG